MLENLDNLNNLIFFFYRLFFFVFFFINYALLPIFYLQ